MPKNYQVGLIIKGNAKGGVSAVKATKDELAQLNSKQKRFQKEAQTSRASIGGMTKDFGLLKGVVAGVSFGVLASEVYKGIDAFQGYRGQLKTITGSFSSASAELDRLIGISKETPFTLAQSVEGFTKLTHLGLDPSRESMISYGNTAAAMGKDLMQMIEAVADASVGEFERLKEFGIKASSQGDKVRFTFQGNSTTIKKDAASIQQYLIDLGNSKFGDAMSDQMGRLSAKTSNLETSFAQLSDAFGSAGASSSVGGSIDAIALGVDGLRENLPAVISVVETLSVVAGGHLVAALARSGKGLIDNKIAAMAKIQANVQLQASEVLLAKTANSKAIQEQLAAKRAALSVTTTQQKIIATKRLAAANANATASEAALTVATNAHTTAMQRANVTSRLLGGSMALLGGPVGVAMLAGYALYEMSGALAKVETDAELLQEALGGTKESIDALSKSALTTQIALTNKKISFWQEYIDAAKQAIEENEKMAKEFNTGGLYNSSETKADIKTGDLSNAEREVKALSDALAILQNKLEGLEQKEKASETDELTGSTIQLAKETQTLIDRLDPLATKSRQFGVEMKQLHSSYLSGALNLSEYEKHIASLVAEFEKSTAVKGQELSADQKFIDSLKEKVRLGGMSEAQKQAEINLSKLSIKATGQQRQEVDKYTAALIKQQKIDTDKQKEVDSYQELIDGIDGYSDAWASAGNVIIDTFGSIGQQMEKMFVSQDKYTEALKYNQKEQAKGGSNLKKLKAEEIKLNYASTQAQINSYGSIAGAAAGMFSKKTAAAKTFHAIEQTMAVASLAMSVQKMMMGTTETGVHVANETTKQGSNALTAITSAFAAPFPINFAAGAAMIAIMASLLGGSFSGGGGSSGNGTGSASTVKGGGVSESLSKANEGLEDIMIDQLAELRGLRSDITNVQNLSYGLLDSLLNVDVGHHEIKNATERELERSIRGLNTGVASGDFTNELSAIFDGIDEAIDESVDVLGLKTKSSLANFVFEVGTISFDGLDADKAGERLDQILSAQSDLMVESIAPFITEYQKLGEGTLETLVRVAKEQTVFNDTLDKLGMSLSDLSEVMQIDVAQSLIDLTGGFDKFSELSGSFFDNFFTDAERFEFLEKSLTETFDSLGLSMVSSKGEFRALIEGLDLTTETGQELFAGLLEINPAFAEYIDELEEQKEATAEAIEAEKELAFERMQAISSLKSDITQLVDDLISPDYQSLIKEEEQRWKNQQDAADELYKTEMQRYEGALNAEKTLDEYINGLAFSENSTLSDRQQQSLAKSNFNDAVKRAGEGDYSAVSDATSDASQYLDIGKERFGLDSQTYKDMFKYVNRTLSGLSDFYADFEAPEQQIIEESPELISLREQLAESQAAAQQAENQALADLLTSQLTDLSALSGDSIDSLIESFSIDLAQLGDLLSVNLVELIDITKQGVPSLIQPSVSTGADVVVPVDNVIAFPEVNAPIVTGQTTEQATSNLNHSDYAEVVSELKLLRAEVVELRKDSNGDASDSQEQRQKQIDLTQELVDETVTTNNRIIATAGVV